jgi:hypothetical protein
MIPLYFVVAFFVDLAGDGHFAVSKQSWTSFKACDAAAGDYATANQGNPDVKEVWAACVPIPGTTA